MRMREAYQLGKMLVKPEHRAYLSEDWGQGLCGCALGMVYAATHTSEETQRLTAKMDNHNDSHNRGEYMVEALQPKYPNFSLTDEDNVTSAFNHYRNAFMTEEDLLRALDQADHMAVEQEHEYAQAQG
jgi:hypothetical protein